MGVAPLVLERLNLLIIGIDRPVVGAESLLELGVDDGHRVAQVVDVPYGPSRSIALLLEPVDLSLESALLDGQVFIPFKLVRKELLSLRLLVLIQSGFAPGKSVPRCRRVRSWIRRRPSAFLSSMTF